jgi:hypothetical protein
MPDALLRYALRAADGPADATIMAHVEECAACREETRAIRATAEALRAMERPTGNLVGCLDELTLAAISDGALPTAERAEAFAHLATCSSCRGRLSSVVRLLNDPAVTEAQRSLLEASPATWGRRHPGRARWVAAASVLTGLAAALVLVVMDPRFGRLARDSSAVTPSGHRGQAITTTSAPRPIAPHGAAANQDTLRWTSVPHADRYRVLMFNENGTVAHEAELTDTVLVLPASLRAPRKQLYFWKVEARTGWDRWVASDLVELPPGPSR